MTEPDLSGERRDCGRDAGAYVLGALELGEVEEFRRHMRECIVCRDEVAALGEVVSRLPMAAPQLAVSPALRRRVLADVRAARKAAARERRGRAPFSLRLPVARRPLAGAAALAGTIAIAAAVIAGSSGSTHARVFKASVAPRSSSAVLRLAAGHAELIVRRMPPPPTGKVYEVWLKRGSLAPEPTSALFEVTAAGAAEVDVPGDLRGVGEVLVTPEPRGGSPRPTHAPVIVARLA